MRMTICGWKPKVIATASVKLQMFQMNGFNYLDAIVSLLTTWWHCDMSISGVEIGVLSEREISLVKTFLIRSKNITYIYLLYSQNFEKSTKRGCLNESIFIATWRSDVHSIFWYTLLEMSPFVSQLSALPTRHACHWPVSTIKFLSTFFKPAKLWLRPATRYPKHAATAS